MKRPAAQSFPLDWSLTELDKKTGRPNGESIPARVPGGVYNDLFSSGKIPDPYIGLNSHEIGWVNDRDWLYRGEAKVAAEPGKRHWLEFRGLDYYYTIRWNGADIHRGEGMFSRRLFEVEARSEANIVEVCFQGIPDTAGEKYLPPNILNTEIARRSRLKTHMSYGWDFAPPMKGCGIWDRASLYLTGKVRIDDVWIKTRNDGTVDLEIILDSAEPIEVSLNLTLTGETFDGYEKKEEITKGLSAGHNKIKHTIHIDSPRLWWPWDQGTPELYRLSVEVENNDEATETFGLREIGWARNPGSKKSDLDWTLMVNGRRVFMRGANLVPFESMPGRTGDDQSAKLMQLAREANLNAVRVWGGGNREHEAFYDECNRLGILVWQEFPIACINGFLPRSKKFLALLDRESREIVRQLRNHPCLIQWCGGNEFNTRLNRPAVRVMETAVRELDPGRRFTAASPHRGDAHNWLVWHLKGNLRDYEEDDSRLVSEFGLQAPPAVESLRSFLPGDLLWPPGKGWAHHHFSRGKMEKCLRAMGLPVDSLEAYVASAQLAQSYYLQRGIEAWRRKKYEKSGAFFWQLNDPWPGISWSVIDYYLRPKPGYQAVKLACQPLLPSAEFEARAKFGGEEFTARITVVNDGRESQTDLSVEVEINNKLVETLRLDIGADEVKQAGEVTIDLPAGEPPMLSLAIKSGGETIATNFYDLTLHDPQRAPWLLRRLFKRYWQILGD